MLSSGELERVATQPTVRPPADGHRGGGGSVLLALDL